ncbi:sensor domain-containing diguanylate cyclase [Sphingomonas montanisoli]|uniref:Diguanylate cyclase n=1 Tax=Sphingomonas montanisoli TaxID=2606412 RepID=A0A5D9CF10_9SPHN|nr:sensor domain-containing diguanylate cyclase [Sphingomonas montanisoli]TZG28685.1 diguanylate cyclase [Sphingomonas montanisoli]
MLHEDAQGDLAVTELRLSQALLALQSVIAAADGHVELAIGAVLEGALRLVPSADGVLVAVTEPAGLICRAARGSFETLAGRRLDGVTHSAEIALSEGRYMYDPDIGSGGGFAPMIARLGARSVAVVPIPFRAGHVGVLKIGAARPDAFTEEHQLAIRLLAGPLALAFLGSAHLEASEGHESADRRFVATFEQAAVGMAHVGPDGGFMRVNQRFCEIAGYKNDELLAGGFQQITHPDDLEIDEHHVAELIDGAADSYTLEKRYIRSDGETVWVNLTVSLVRNQAAAPEFFVAVVEDISARKIAEQAARRDSLTGLLNRRGLIELLNQMVDPGSDREAFVLAFLDMDGFKNVNDQLGHDEGDRCLVSIAETLIASRRRGDRLARLGGDEFVMILPNTAEAEARPLIDEACQAIKSDAEACGWPISVSAGAVAIPDKTSCLATDIIAAADRLMYRAKRSKRSSLLIETYAPPSPQ